MSEQEALKEQVRYYKRKTSDLQELVNNQKKLIDQITEQFSIGGEMSELLNRSADSLPGDFFKSYCKRIFGSQEKQYSGPVRRFALTLQSFFGRRKTIVEKLEPQQCSK